MKTFRRTLIFGALVLTIIGAGIVLAGDSDLPPQVIAVQPFPGEEMRLDEPLTIIFNQGMDQNAAQNAVTFSPEVSGQYEWADDRTLVFTPSDGWQRDSTYDVIVDVSAAAANGLPLEEDYSFTARSVGRLEVASIIPEANVTGVAADVTITVAFNRPVVPLVSTDNLDDLPQPLTIEPSVDGAGEWLNTSIYQFTPDDALAGGSTYTVTVNAGLTDFSGATLDEDFVWRFETLAPEILSTSPTEGAIVELSQAMTINFSQPMDKPATEESFTLFSLNDGAPVAGEFVWSEDSRSLTFTPDAMLTIDSPYRFVVNEELARGEGGASVRGGRDFQFRSFPLPFVESTWPNNGETDVRPGFNTASIRFGTPMNTETFEGKIEISPEPPEWEPIVGGNRNLSMQFEFLPETTYTITLKSGSEDVYGNAIMSDYTYRFTVGIVDSTAWMPDAGSFIVTGAYRENTVLPVTITATPTVDFALYELPIERLETAVRYLYQEDSMRQLSDPDRLLRKWQQELKGNSTFDTVLVNLNSEEGGALPLGTYFLLAVQGDPSYYNEMPVSIAVTNSAVTYKRTPDGILIWVTDMESGNPLADQAVTIYNGANVAARGTTNADGILQLDLGSEFDFPFLAITSQSEGKFGVYHSSNAPTPPTTDLYIYTDRPIYRPDETLYFRGSYRSRDDMSFEIVPPVETLDFIINANYGQQIMLEDSVTLNEFGTFSGEFVLPEDTPIGSLAIEIYRDGAWIGSAQAQVAEFRVPEFSVGVTPDFDEIIAGDALRAVVNGSFFSGGSVSNAQLSWFAEAYQTFFNYTGPGRYSFSDTQQGFFFAEDIAFGYGYGYGRSYRSLGNGEGTTDSAGNFIIELDDTTPPGPYPEQISIEATINDESGQFISGRTNVVIHPSEVYVGVRTTEYFGEEGEPITAEIITVTPDSDIVPNHNVTLTFIENRWEREPIEGQFGRYNWTQTEIEVDSKRVSTDDAGLASVEFTPPNAGTFIIRAETRDDRERLHRSGTQIWVVGDTPVWWGQPSNNIDLVADEDSYVPGDTAEILVPVSLQGESWLLITLERDGVVQHEVQRVEGSTFVYELPITDDYAPTIHLSVVVMHGIDADNSIPAHRTGTIALQVEPISKRIDLKVTPSDSNAQPGQEVTLDVETTDPSGNPAQAEVGLALVDSAILSLSGPNSIDPEQHFYGGAGNFTFTATMLDALIDGRLENIEEEIAEDRQQLGFDDAAEQELAVSPTAGAGEAVGFAGGAAADALAAPQAALANGNAAGRVDEGANFQDVTVREDFQQTPLWEPHLVTDENGRAQISVTMPDNLTVWSLSARALTRDTLVGAQSLDISSTLPLLVRPATPRFFVEGDEVTLAMVVNNNTSDVQSIATTMQGTGYELIDGTEMEQTVEVEADSRARVEWRVKIVQTDRVDLTFIAVGADGFEDAAKPPLATGPDGSIPVYRYTAPDTVGTGGVLREGGSRTEGISIPPIADTDQGELTLSLDPSLAVTTIDSLDYLKNHWCRCVELAISRMLPNVMTLRALKSLGVSDPDLENTLSEHVSEAIIRLESEQNGDGGWGWFRGMESHPVVTAYALLGLSEARDVGFAITSDSMNRAAAYVRGHVINPNEDTEPYLLNRQAFFFYAFARYGNAAFLPSSPEMTTLFDLRLEMSLYARAYLMMTMDETGADPNQIQALTSDLITNAKLSATGAHWEEEFHDWWNWNSDIRSTAIVLSALIRTVPDNELLPNAIRWLMVARQGDHWETTQETAWAVMSLTDWMVTTNELQGNYDYALALNRQDQLTGTVTPENVREGQKLQIAVSDLLLDDINRLTVIRSEGEGALYYNAHLRLRLDAAEVDAINRGVGVTREYFVDGEETPITEAKMGDVITVRLTLNVPEAIYFFVLEDPLPAGTEAVNTSLLTTSRAVEGPRLRPEFPPYYYWGWWWFDHTEIRDEQVNLFADFLPAGTYVYSYQTQATVPGKFQTMPAHAYAFYFPELFGRSDGELFTILPDEE